MYPYLLPIIALNCSIRTFLVFCSSLSSSPCSCSICIGIISAFSRLRNAAFSNCSSRTFCCPVSVALSSVSHRTTFSSNPLLSVPQVRHFSKKRLPFSRRVSYTTLLAVVLFPFADNRCADNSSSAGKQQCDPQHEVAVIAGLRILRQFRRYSVGLGDFLGAVFVTVILIAAVAVTILQQP